MMKRFVKFFTNIKTYIIILGSLFVLGLSLSLTMFKAYSATVSGTYKTLSYSSSNNTDTDITWSLDENAGTIQGSVPQKKDVTDDGCSSTTTYSSISDTLTLTNSNDDSYIVEFDFNVTLNGGSVKINDKSYDTANSASITLAKGDSIRIMVSSSNANEDKGACSISISNFDLLSTSIDSDILCKSVLDTSYGTYKVEKEDDSSVTVSNEDVTISQRGGNLIFTAIPNQGYRFHRRKNFTKGNYIFDNPYTMPLTGNATMQVEFLKEDAPTFVVNGSEYYSLDSAISAVNELSSNKNIYLKKDGAVEAGTYDLESGVSLIIPRDQDFTVPNKKNEPGIDYNVYTAPTKYVELMIKSGAIINVKSGADIFIASKICTKGQGNGYNGSPYGPNGRINILDGGKINIKSGGYLYAYGYIYGNGIVEAESGSRIYECFQIRNWRGGTATSTCQENNIFPFNQYYIQNIESTLKMNAGAFEYCVTAVNASRMGWELYDMPFIGDKNSGLFRIISGTLTKRYNTDTDYLDFNLTNGVAHIQNIVINIGSIITVDSSNYILPLQSNFNISVDSDSTIYLSANMTLLPGCKMSVEKGGNIYINNEKKIIVYDNDDYVNYMYTDNKKLYNVGYTASGNSLRTKIDEDASIDINGSFILNEGAYIYCTNGGANVFTSRGTGKIVFTSSTGENTNYVFKELENNATSKEVSTKYVSLQNWSDVEKYNTTNHERENGDTSYETTNLPENHEVLFSKTKDKVNQGVLVYNGWYNQEAVVGESAIDFYEEDGSTLIDSQTYIAGESFTFLDSNHLNSKGYKVKYWKIKGNDGDYSKTDPLERLEFIPGNSYIMPNLGDLEIYPVYEGFIQYSDGFKLLLGSNDDNYSYASGFYQINSLQASTNISTLDYLAEGDYLYFNSSNIFNSGMSQFLNKDGTEYFILNGIRKNSYNGLYQNPEPLSTDQTLYLIENGIKKTDFTGFYNDNNVKKYINSGVFMNATTGKVQIENTYYYVVEGILQDQKPLIFNGEYFVEGIWQKDFDGFAEIDSINYFILKGVFQNNENGLVDFNGKKYLLNNGILNISFTGEYLNSIDGDTYYIKNGIYDPEVTGIIEVGSAFKYYINGIFASEYTGVVADSGDKYFVNNGFVQQEAGLHSYINNGITYYYYVTSNFTIYFDGNYFVEETSNLLPIGYYEFDKNGFIAIKNSSFKSSDIEIYVESDQKMYATINGVCVPYGLFSYNGLNEDDKNNTYYYYATDGGEIVINALQYIELDSSKQPALYEEYGASGLFYFNAKGHMCNPYTNEEILVQ